MKIIVENEKEKKELLLLSQYLHNFEIELKETPKGFRVWIKEQFNPKALTKRIRKKRRRLSYFPENKEGTAYLAIDELSILYRFAHLYCPDKDKIGVNIDIKVKKKIVTKAIG